MAASVFIVKVNLGDDFAKFQSVILFFLTLMNMILFTFFDKDTLCEMNISWNWYKLIKRAKIVQLRQFANFIIYDFVISKSSVV